MIYRSIMWQLLDIRVIKTAKRTSRSPHSPTKSIKISLRQEGLITVRNSLSHVNLQWANTPTRVNHSPCSSTMDQHRTQPNNSSTSKKPRSPKLIMNIEWEQTIRTTLENLKVLMCKRPVLTKVAIWGLRKYLSNRGKSTSDMQTNAYNKCLTIH